MKKSSIALALVVGLTATFTGCGGGDTEESVLPGVEAILFEGRSFQNADGDHELGGMGNVFSYTRYVPGGGLYLLSPPTPDGTLTDLTADFDEVDVAGHTVTFDGEQVVFAMRHSGLSNYQIFVANLDGSEIRQLTFAPYNHVQPTVLPGDRVAIITNRPATEIGSRNDEYNHGGAVSQVAFIGLLDGEASYLATGDNLSHVTNTGLLSDGRVLVSRWEHEDNVNDLKLNAMNPDGTNQIMLAGQFGKRFNSYVQVRPVPDQVCQFIGIATSREGTFQSGALMFADARSRTSSDPNRCDVQTVEWRNLTPDVPTGMESSTRGVGRYRRPLMMNDGKILVSWSDGPVNETLEIAETAPQYGIYLFDPETQERTLIYDDPELWDLYATPVMVRDVPPVLGSNLRDPDDPSGVIGSIDVQNTSLDRSINGGLIDGLPLAEALRDHAYQVRIIEGSSTERTGVAEHGLTMAEGATIVGFADVYQDGSWEARVPARMPYRFDVVDEFGMSLTRGVPLWVQLQNSEERRCGGCHADRSGQVLPRNGPTTIAQQVGPQDFFASAAERASLGDRPWWQRVDSGQTTQAIFDAKCAGCHDGGAMDPYAGMFYTVTATDENTGMTMDYQIPYLDLSARLITTFYEMEEVSYPASYVTTVMPGAMMGDVMFTGAVPPEWMVSKSARTSRLIEVINPASSTDPGRRAFGDAPPHPTELGAPGLTVAEERWIVDNADLGNQAFSPITNIDGAGGY